MQLKEIIQFLEEKAPLSLQESYDNSGLICGNPSMEIKGAIICLDSTEDVIEEAIRHGYNLVIAHHPIVFTGLKKLNGKNYIERTIIKAIKNDIAIYAIHTNLDNVKHGVNAQIAKKIGLINCQVLSPITHKLLKLSTYVPIEQAEFVKEALFKSGAGNIGNYSECSFTTNGEGTFKGGNESNPQLGEKNIRFTGKEVKIEVVLEKPIQSQVLAALKSAHPYEEVAYELIALENKWQDAGAGIIGDITNETNTLEFLKSLKTKIKTDCIRYTKPINRPIKRVAVCGGAGSFLLEEAKRSGADIFITGDFKYHQFFDADNEIVIADIGHYESEQYTNELLGDWLSEKFPTFAIRLTEINTNPINYI
ncbi:MAG: Nif3-like dinuclear metal center hexameric protein [Bacteroidota bacterium]